eukprot:scaffold76841_cov69-Phaeocystis_antarctica.AAC.4
MVPPPEALSALPSRATEPPPPRGQGGGTAAPAGLLVPRRVSLVLFAAPPHSARLDPVLDEPGEAARFRKGAAGTWRAQAMRAHKQV